MSDATDDQDRSEALDDDAELDRHVELLDDGEAFEGVEAEEDASVWGADADRAPAAAEEDAVHVVEEP